MTSYRRQLVSFRFRWQPRRTPRSAQQAGQPRPGRHLAGWARRWL